MTLCKSLVLLGKHWRIRGQKRNSNSPRIVYKGNQTLCILYGCLSLSENLRCDLTKQQHVVLPHHLHRYIIFCYGHTYVAVDIHVTGICLSVQYDNMITNILDEQLVVSWYLIFFPLLLQSWTWLVVEGLGHMVGFLNLHGNVQRFVKWSSGWHVR